MVFGCFESVDGVFAGGRATTIRTSPGCPRHAHPALRSVPYYYAPPFCLQKCNPPSPSGCSTVCCHAAIFAPPCQSITSQLFLAIPQLLVHRSKAMDCSSPRPRTPSLCPAPTTPLVRQGSFFVQAKRICKSSARVSFHHCSGCYLPVEEQQLKTFGR